MDIYSVTVTFPWSSTQYNFHSGSTITVASGNSYDFTGTVTVSQSATVGSGTVSVAVYGKAAGDWWANTGTAQASITVYSIGTLTVSATANPNSGNVPLTVSFTTSVSGGISPYTYSWSFGDGSTSSSANPSHTYSTAGTYTAQVTVTDSASQTNRQTKSASTTINVTTLEQTFQVIISFTKPDGSALANTVIYYGTSEGQETTLLGTTNSSGEITTSNTALADQTVYFKSSDEYYSGEAYIGTTGGTVSVSTAYSPGVGVRITIITIFLALLIILGGVGGVIAWKKTHSKTPAGHKFEEKASHAHSAPAGYQCPHCKTKLPHDADFCPDCGKKVKGG